jgi:hypothetical protein
MRIILESLWQRLAVGRATATARSTDSGVRRPQMADGREGAFGEIGQSSPVGHLLRDPALTGFI